MKAYLPVIAGLLVALTPAAQAGAPKPSAYPRCVNDGDIFLPPEEDSLSEGLSTADKPLHEAGVRLLKDFVCHGSEKCWAKHGPRLTRAAYTVVDVCLSEPDIPKYMCLGFVANIANEGGGLEHPTCGGLSQECVRQCDTLGNDRARNDCFLQCALDQGIRRGSVRWNRVKFCNDRGTSRGPFQMKRSRIKQCKSKAIGMPEDFDPFDLAQSARCMMRITRRAALSKRFACGRVENRWMVAHKRVTQGVLRLVAKAQPGRWISSVHKGEKKWLPPTKPVYEQICSESGYARLGLRYYRACGKKCQLVQREKPKVEQKLTQN